MNISQVHAAFPRPTPSRLVHCCSLLPALAAFTALAAPTTAAALSWDFAGETLLRYENWNWFGSGGADRYDYSLARLRINASLRGQNWELRVQPQLVRIEGLPQDAVQTPPRGPAGMGGLYFAHNGKSAPISTGLHQAYLKWTNVAGRHLDLTLGRMDYASGLEHLRKADGGKFNTLKTLRLGDRLLSSFAWSAFGRSFDGLRADYRDQNDRLALTMAAFAPTQGGWEKDFNETMEDVQIATAVLTLPRGTLYTGAEASAFAIYYRDERDCSQRIDNTSRMCDRADISLTTFGGHLIGIHPLGTGQWDYLLWGSLQVGDWYQQDHTAWSLAAEAGYQWTAAPAKPWLRAGLYSGSGDGDPADEDHETFFQLAPGTRKYQLFPYYDLQNSSYAFVQAFLFPTPGVTLRLDYTWARLTDDADRWYMGTGPTQERGSIFGYLARPSSGENDLSKEISLMAKWQPMDWLTLEAFASHVEGGDVISALYPEEEEADFVSLQAHLTF